jgi:myo-inositol 2-dehydrogenase / D-chiro-inositol 1-dehydrogenase
MQSNPSTRRTFLQQSGVLAGAALGAAVMAGRVHAAEDNTIKIALVGCGGRGTGAASQALSTKGPTKLVAMADAFADRLNTSRHSLAKQLAEKMDVPPERQFVGLDAYRKAIDAVSPGGVVILATAPAFRPIHLEYAVSQGCNVFMEKSFAVDAAGVRRVLRAGQEAEKKNLKIAGGLMCRHNVLVEEAVRRIHDGAIGEIVTAHAYRTQGAAGHHARRPNESEFAYQIRNFSLFTWGNGSIFIDFMIHDLDLCCWLKGAWPVSAQGQGGRQVRTEADDMYDHVNVEYTFADGTRLVAQSRHISGCWDCFIDVIHGVKGSANLCSYGEGANRPRLYKSYRQTPENLIWQGDKRIANACGNSYQREHDLLFAAIREDKPWNETERCAKAAMTGILGRMVVESGKRITWDEAMASNVELAPGLDRLTFDSPAPVLPDADGRYPIAMPGFTKVL